MKKKFISMLLVLCMSVGVCACSKAEGSNEVASKDESIGVETEANVEDSSEEVEKETESERPEWLDYFYEENNFGYSMWITNIERKAAGYGYECSGTLEKKSKTENIYITQYSGEVGDERQLDEINMSSYNTSEDIFDLLAPNFNNELFYAGWEMTDYSVEIIETKQINELQMTKFEGTMNVVFDETDNHECPFVAYGIAAKNSPVLVTCIDRSEGSIYHEEWLNKIDEMVATFKDAE